LKYKAKLRARKKIQEYQVMIQQTLSAKLWLPDTGDVKPISIQILNTIYESLFIVVNFIDGNQYNAHVADGDPINDTTFFNSIFHFGRNSERLFMLDRNMCGSTLWNSLIT